jgi:hypothetical protein
MTEEQLNAALAEWLDAPAGLPGQNNAMLLSLNPSWMSCTTNAERAAFLETYSPISTIWALAKNVVDDIVFWIGIDMIVQAVLRELRKMREQGTNL